MKKSLVALGPRLHTWFLVESKTFSDPVCVEAIDSFVLENRDLHQVITDVKLLALKHGCGFTWRDQAFATVPTLKVRIFFRIQNPSKTRAKRSPYTAICLAGEA